jgi:hypothetical protein
MNAIVLPAELELDPLEIDPRPCEYCCLTIDRHQRVDTPEGPEFFCIDFSPDEMTLDELERREELRRQEEVAAIIARWEAMDIEIATKRAEPEPYRPAASTLDAFWFVVGLDDPERLASWLRDRPQDAPFLLKLLETK